MRIAQLAPLVESVPPSGYGGTELVVSLLTEQFVKEGHEVTLFASGDSQTSARLVSVEDTPLRNHFPIHRWNAYDIRLLLKLVEMQDEFDIIHNHMGYQALPTLCELRKPMVTTNHNLVKDYCRPIYFAYGKSPFVAISEAYRRLNYPEKLNYVDVVYNGIDLEPYQFNADAKRDYLLFLGRICQDKGTAPAIEIAKKLGLPLKIAGKIDTEDGDYYEKNVKQHIGGNIEYVGEVNMQQKIRLYSGAIAVVYPIDFEEPFGLVMAESLACGTPLMAFDRGSVREVLSDGETAVIGNTVDDLVARFPEIEKISAQTCRNRVENLFSKEVMARNYLNVYSTLVAREPVSVEGDAMRRR
jgi:glycosyltransferase involved in cell wall biosynthesis